MKKILFLLVIGLVLLAGCESPVEPENHITFKVSGLPAGETWVATISTNSMMSNPIAAAGEGFEVAGDVSSKTYKPYNFPSGTYYYAILAGTKSTSGEFQMNKVINATEFTVSGSATISKSASDFIPVIMPPASPMPNIDFLNF